jgi:lysophospholipase L1-like esterase
MSVEASMHNLTAVVERIRQTKDVPILVYNLSPIIPGDFVHCYIGLDETYATRIKRFNLALIELSQSIGISIVDLDAIVARHGADTLKLDAMHLTAEGYKRVAEEVVRILNDLGVFDDEETGV